MSEGRGRQARRQAGRHAGWGTWSMCAVGTPLSGGGRCLGRHCTGLVYLTCTTMPDALLERGGGRRLAGRLCVLQVWVRISRFCTL